MERITYNSTIGKSNAKEIAANENKEDAITISYDLSGSFTVYGIQTRFKKGLEDCIISIKNVSTSDDIISGEVQFSQIGNSIEAQVPRDELPVEFILEQGMKLQVSAKANLIPIKPNDLNVTLFGKRVHRK